MGKLILYIATIGALFQLSSCISKSNSGNFAINEQGFDSLLLLSDDEYAIHIQFIDNKHVSYKSTSDNSIIFGPLNTPKLYKKIRVNPKEEYYNYVALDSNLFWILTTGNDSLNFYQYSDTILNYRWSCPLFFNEGEDSVFFQSSYLYGKLVFDKREQSFYLPVTSTNKYGSKRHYDSKILYKVTPFDQIIKPCDITLAHLNIGDKIIPTSENFMAKMDDKILFSFRASQDFLIYNPSENQTNMVHQSSIDYPKLKNFSKETMLLDPNMYTRYLSEHYLFNSVAYDKDLKIIFRKGFYPSKGKLKNDSLHSEFTIYTNLFEKIGSIKLDKEDQYIDLITLGKGIILIPQVTKKGKVQYFRKIQILKNE